MWLNFYVDVRVYTTELAQSMSQYYKETEFAAMKPDHDLTAEEKYFEVVIVKELYFQKRQKICSRFWAISFGSSFGDISRHLKTSHTWFGATLDGWIWLVIFSGILYMVLGFLD